jgi:large subunit ribosomal protein L25
MSTPTLIKTTARDGIGSQVSRRERVAGQVPVNVYGHGKDNVVCKVDEHELELAFASSDQVFNLEINGATESCLVKEVQYDTFGQRVLHVDFTRIDLSEQVSVEVTVEFRGDPAGVAAGGTKMIHHPTLSVNCRADSIPDFIVVEISALEIGQSLHAGEIELPAGVTLDEASLAPGEQVVAVAAPRVEIEEPVEGEDAAEGEEAADGEKAEKKDEGGDADKDGGKGDSKS